SLKAPAIPARSRCAGEQLAVGAGDNCLFRPAGPGRVAAVLALWRDDQFANGARDALRVAAREEQAKLGIGARVVAGPHRKQLVVRSLMEQMPRRRFATQLRPIEPDRLELEAPAF